ncbi:uncharacterized protein A4U43_C07F30270 [Asparagus officinalis]|uniref:Uncharacterized protein n=1 Tax=Asparagus officinalis TaxID=4686 RepID=A0A5P1EI14_ASPOF|nr:uncharacterized protein A4U43_C07F30270 [Asparagus officinalis]
MSFNGGSFVLESALERFLSRHPYVRSVPKLVALSQKKKGYFALQLPRGWWVFGLDQALQSDIDVYQFKFFAELCQSKVRMNMMLSGSGWKRTKSKCDQLINLGAKYVEGEDEHDVVWFWLEKDQEQV